MRRSVRPGVPRVPRDGPLPLSFSETRLWFLDQFEPGTLAYHVHDALHLRGALDEGALERALVEIVARHESLRSRFEARDGEAQRVIDPPGRFALERSALDGLAPEEREEAARRRLRRAAAEPFDLAKGPLFRALLVRIEGDRHVLFMAAHHIVFDGWSWGIVARELQALYGAFLRGQPSPLEPPPLQYADFAAWERSPAQEKATDERLASWKEHLTGVPALELPTDRYRPAKRSTAGAKASFHLDAATTAALKKFSREQRSTLFMTVLGAFSMLMARYAGQRDFAVGTPVAHRTRLELESVIGCFVSTLALRVDASGDPTLREFLARLRQETMAGLSHEDVPFERLVEELQPERDPSRPPIAQVFLAWQNFPGTGLALPGLEVETYPVVSPQSAVDLTAYFFEEGETLCADFVYATAVFDASTIHRMIEHLRILVDAILRTPDQRLFELPILAEKERQLIVRGWNDTERDYDREATLIDLFERSRERVPDAVAVTSGIASLTYAEVGRQANQLAHHLLRCGVKTGEMVGLCVDRGPRMIVALLAILKAGAAYVPLDPTYPKDRLAFMLESAKARTLVTERAVRSSLPPFGGHMIVMDGAEGEATDEAVTSPPRAARADHIAYVIYTSGSTGRPKGVFVQHRAVVNLIDWVNRTYQVTSSDRLLFVTSLSFDLSVYDVFGILAAGGSVRVASAAEVREPSRLLDILANEPITFWDSAPAMLQNVSNLFPSEPLTQSALRLVFLSGDWIPLPLPAAVRQVFPKALVVSLGGATEATVWSNHHPVGAIEPHWRSIPYGRPMQNARYHVLDAYLEPAPIGVPGDLYIGGDCLSCGYWNDAELTASKYIPDPFGRRPGARLYRTGDRARYWADGNIEFLGRLDAQVKLRGFRIELGEVDAALGAHPQVKESIAVVREDHGEKRLVAYVVPRRDAESPAPEGLVRDLLQTVAQRLPPYMVPSSLVLLPSMPLTASGKIDRRALPAPLFGGSAAAFVAPRTRTEQRLAELWQDLLKVDRVGAHDSFFDVGGHSLLATRMVVRIAREFGVQLPLRIFFESPQLSALAARLDRRTTSIPPAGDPLARVPRVGALPLAYEEETFWRWHRIRPRRAGWNTCRVLRLTGALDKGALETALAALLRRHETLRMGVRDAGDVSVRVLLEPPPVRLDVVDLSRVTGEAEQKEQIRVRGEAMEDERFDFAKGPMFRASLLRFDPELHVLLLCTNHIAIDAAGGGVMFDDVERLYAAAIGAEPPPADLRVQVADYAVWQRAQTASAEMRRRLSFWRSNLAGAEPLKLPADKHPTAERTVAVPSSFDLSRVVTDSLVALAKQEQATLFNVLTAGLKATLHARTGQTDLILATPWSTREQHEDLERVVGNIVDHALLRSSAAGNPTFRELVRREAAASTSAFANWVPLQLLADIESPMDHPFMRSVVNFFGAITPKPPGVVGGLLFEPSSLPSRALYAHEFDLLVLLWESHFGVGGEVVMADDMFERDTREKFVSEYVGMLENAAAQPDRRIGDGSS